MRYDLAVIGGGMVGLALASVLKNTELKILLVDASLESTVNDERLIALNDASVCLFENSGIWHLLYPNAAAIKQVHVSKRGRFGVARIDADIVDLAALGYVVPAKYINVALQSNLADAKNITILKPATLESLTQGDDGVQLSIKIASDLVDYTAKQVIGADGSYSTVRALLDMPTEIVDYQQTALVTTTTLQRDHRHIAYERFLDTGAIAMLPLTGMRVATIWTAASEVVAGLVRLSDGEFLSQLQENFGYRLGRLQSVGKRATYPLKMIKAKQQRHKHVWLIGNAAHTMHPIAAQGLNVALYEVAIVATALLENNPSMMDKIDQQRFSQRLSHRLTWLFSSDMFVLNHARQAGILALDVLSGLKKRFATKAVGNNGFVPTLLTRKDE